MTAKRFVSAWVATVALGLAAEGGLITSASQIGNPQTVIDFSQFAGANTVHPMGPVQVGGLVGADVTFESTNPDGSLLGSMPYSFNDNGTWGNVAMAALDVDAFGGDQYTMTFHFASPVAGVGGLVNYAVFDGSGFSDVVMSALDAHGSVLESYDLNAVAPISTPGAANGGRYRGIARTKADIAYFSLSNSAVAITDLTFSQSPFATPEPESVVLVLSGLVALAVVRVRGASQHGGNRAGRTDLT